MAKKANTQDKVQEPETVADKKAAKKVVGEPKGTGKAVKAAKEAAPAKVKGPTIQSVAIAALKEGKGAKETLAIVKEQFPDAKTSMACIYWYANKNDIKLQKPAAPKPAKAEKQVAAA